MKRRILFIDLNFCRIGDIIFIIHLNIYLLLLTNCIFFSGKYAGIRCGFNIVAFWGSFWSVPWVMKVNSMQNVTK